MKKTTLTMICIAVGVLLTYLVLPIISTLSENTSIRNENDMLQIISNQTATADTLQVIDIVTCASHTLITATNGKTAPENHCYAAEFLNLENHTYSFSKILPLTQCGNQSYLCKWQNGYAFICNNPHVASLKIVLDYANGSLVEQVIPVPQTPWFYYYPLLQEQNNYQGTFLFLDHTGTAI